jgi:hypothetical protein
VINIIMWFRDMGCYTDAATLAIASLNDASPRYSHARCSRRSFIIRPRCSLALPATLAFTVMQPLSTSPRRSDAHRCSTAHPKLVVATTLVVASLTQRRSLTQHRSSSPHHCSNAHRRLARRKDMDDSDARSSNWQRSDAMYVRGVN